MDYEELSTKWALEIESILQEKYGITPIREDLQEWLEAIAVTENEDAEQLAIEYMEDTMNALLV